MGAARLIPASPTARRGLRRTCAWRALCRDRLMGSSAGGVVLPLFTPLLFAFDGLPCAMALRSAALRWALNQQRSD